MGMSLFNQYLMSRQAYESLLLQRRRSALLTSEEWTSDTTKRTTTSSSSKSTLPPVSKVPTSSPTPTQSSNMYTIKPFPQYNLTESGQENPIRWTFVHIDGDVLTPLAPTMKCKDYFNDVVAAKNNTFFIKYGFDNKCIPLQEGLDVLLTELVDIDKMPKMILTICHPEHLITIERATEDALLIHIPEYYFKNTYRISLLTYAIRVCNSKTRLSKITDIFTLLKSTIASESSGLSEYGRTFAGCYGWDVPYGEVMWWRQSDKYNSIDAPRMWGLDTIVHNNGVNGWSCSGIPLAVEETV